MWLIEIVTLSSDTERTPRRLVAQLGMKTAFNVAHTQKVLLSSLYSLSDKLTKFNVIVPKSRRYFVLKGSAGTEFPKLSKNLNPVKLPLTRRF
jgi:hypothetical protein